MGGHQGNSQHGRNRLVHRESVSYLRWDVPREEYAANKKRDVADLAEQDLRRDDLARNQDRARDEGHRGPAERSTSSDERNSHCSHSNEEIDPSQQHYSQYGAGLKRRQ